MPLVPPALRTIAAVAASAAVAAGIGAAVPTPSRAAGTDAGAVDFQSPSRNIGCSLDNVLTRPHHHDVGKWNARCDIRHHAWHALKPRNCQFEYSNGLQLWPTGRGQVVCASDTALGNGRILPYGHSITRGNIRCISRTSGMWCATRRPPRHGFVISYQRALLF